MSLNYDVLSSDSGFDFLKLLKIQIQDVKRYKSKETYNEHRNGFFANVQKVLEILNA